jgi:hypothetical protein
MKAWYQSGNLRKRIGEIKDYFDEYVELIDLETGEYVIKHYTEIEII